MPDIKWGQQVPDKLNLQCDIIFQALDKIPIEDKIGVIEQVLDYLRMDENIPRHTYYYEYPGGPCLCEFCEKKKENNDRE